MITVRVTLSEDLKTLADDLESALIQAQDEASRLYVQRARAELQTVGAVAEGKLRDGIHVQETSLKRSTVVAPKPAKLIEEGRPPGAVPRWEVFEPILRRWAQFKGLVIDNLYPIARKIRERGFRARFPFERAKNGSESAIKAVFVSILRTRFK